MESFQCKILNITLFLNKKIHTFEIKPSPMCSFCYLYDGTPFFYIFSECAYVKFLCLNFTKCNTTRLSFLGFLILQTMTPIFKNNKVFINHILLIFKLYVHNSREKKLININNLIAKSEK